MTQLRQAKYRQDYQAPDYTITEIDLDFNLDPVKTVVTAVSKVKRLNPQSSTLELNGEDLSLVSLEVDGKASGSLMLATTVSVVSSVEATLVAF